MNIFIGYDSKESLSYHVLSHSIQRRASRPVSIKPVALDQLKGIYTRQRGPTESTEFSLSRFLVPYLSNYTGRSIFMDCDMLCLGDIWDISHPEGSLDPDGPAVFVCKHDYVPKSEQKFLGNVQTKYPRKNWSSFMIFNNDKCRMLTKEYVNMATGLELHRFLWLPDEKIGSLPLEWNWLVGEYAPNPNAKMLHYTLGGPWFDETKNCDHADLWFAERDHMLGKTSG